MALAASPVLDKLRLLRVRFSSSPIPESALAALRERFGADAVLAGGPT